MIKEVASYEKEVTTNEAKIQKMKDDGKDSYGEICHSARNYFLPTFYLFPLHLQILESKKKFCKKAT